MLPKNAELKSLKRHLSTNSKSLIVEFARIQRKGNERMLKVPQQEHIKCLREFEDLSISEIKETLNINWRTAKKYADKDDWNKPLIKAKRISPVMDAVKDIVDTWLSEDQLIPKKQRHTAKAIFDRLCKEHNFTGGYRTVCTYIEKKKEAYEAGSS